MSHPRETEVVVIGAGPAGSTAARLLKEWGHQVLLLDKPSRLNIAESVPPSCRKPMAEIGALEAVDRAGFYQGRGNTVWWGATEPQVERFADGENAYQVDRRTFDRILLDLAIQAGVAMCRTTASVQGSWDAGDDRAPGIRYDEAREPRLVEGRWVLDCTGRAGVLARRGLRIEEPGYRTTALHAMWHADRWAVPDPSHTLVESYRDGWAWSVPTSATARCVAVMIDPQATGLETGGSLERVYGAELEKAPHLAQLVQNATRTALPGGLGASPYSACQFAGAGWLLVGDAASFLDPLSSFGVKKALASAWLAAVVVHTSLSKPDLRRPALELFEARERQAYDRYAALTAAFFGKGQAAHPHGFWAARAHRGDTSASAAPDDPDVAQLRTDPAVLESLERLKQGSSIRLRPASDIRVLERPTVRDREVVLDEHIVCPWMPGGIRYLRDVNLVRVIALAPQYEQVPDLYEAYNRSDRPVGLPDFMGALSVLVAKRVLQLI